jgi:hypothetical protein
MYSDNLQAQRAKLEQRLTVAEAHIVSSEGHLARQREILKNLESKGLGESAAMAKQLLNLFVEVVRLHTRGRDRVINGLAELG